MYAVPYIVVKHCFGARIILVPARGDANEFNRRLVQAVQNEGKVFLSSTMLEGKFVIRLAVLSFRTHLEQIEQTIEVLRDTARRLEEGGHAWT